VNANAGRTFVGSDGLPVHLCLLCEGPCEYTVLPPTAAFPDELHGWICITPECPVGWDASFSLPPLRRQAAA